MIFKLVENSEELRQILEIQKGNHIENVSSSAKTEQGFVTVKHSMKRIEAMQSKIPQVISKKDEAVVGYALAMHKSLKNFIPILSPMFATFEKIQYQGRKLSEWNYYVIGQVCVSEPYRRKGVFKALYQKHKEVFSKTFECCITEVSSRNRPSMVAHEKVGFKNIHTYRDTTDEWNIILWDWT
ncbi:GNAT family N-acetyltransferase [Flavobacteriaceae bacterium]|nr:GNAT family N-acetyltransferase [Flavobacteriaceae bacterium]